MYIMYVVRTMYKNIFYTNMDDIHPFFQRLNLADSFKIKKICWSQPIPFPLFIHTSIIPIFILLLLICVSSYRNVALPLRITILRVTVFIVVITATLLRITSTVKTQTQTLDIIFLVYYTNYFMYESAVKNSSYISAV